MNQVKKIGLFTLAAFCIGDTIGSGIFSTLPLSVSLVGPGILYAWLAAMVLTVFMNIPAIIPGSALPCPAASYTLQCRLLSPWIGYLETIGILNYIMILAVLAVFFADYVALLVPGAPVLPVAIGVILIFWIINLFGVESGTKIQNIIVVVLLAVLISYVVAGVPHMSAEHLTAKELFVPTGMKFAAFCTSLSLCYNCLGGCFTGCLDLADQVKNPHKNLILAGCVAAISVTAIYAAISIVTCGMTPWQDGLPALGDIAKGFMSTPQWYLFMVGGALFAMASTANAMVLSVGYRISTMAADQIFPRIFNKTCRFGTKPVSLSIAPIAAILIILLDLPMDSLLAACSTLAVLTSILRLLPVLVMPKRYPHTYRHALITMPKGVATVWVLIGIVICVVISISTILETAGFVWVLTFGLLGVLYLYFIIRVKFMKGKGTDILSIMSAPYADWDEKEELYRRQDAEACSK